MAADVTRIAIAVVECAGRYLVGVRGPGAPFEGYHEFPGGKLGDGETPEAGASRECLEESGLEVIPVRVLETIEHEYPHGRVELTFLLCRPATAELFPSAGRFGWIEARQLPSLKFPDANRTIVARLAGVAVGVQPSGCRRQAEGG
jgi:8-oxo-dGTP diphosphatase